MLQEEEKKIEKKVEWCRAAKSYCIYAKRMGLGLMKCGKMDEEIKRNEYCLYPEKEYPKSMLSGKV